MAVCTANFTRALYFARPLERPGTEGLLCLIRSNVKSFQVTGAFAEFERSMIRQRINAGLKRAVEAGKTLGRPRISDKVETRIQEQLRAGKGMNKVAAKLA